MKNCFVDFSVEKLKKEGYRVTTARIFVLTIFRQSQKPLGAYQISKKSASFGKKIDVVTVYRILNLLEKLNLIHKVGSGYVACKKFECENENHCHYQFICEKCSHAEEVHLEKDKIFKTFDNQFPNLTINSHHFEFFGVCENCKK